MNVRAKLIESPDKLWALQEMENTGGEPDVIAYDQQKDEYLFIDCSVESPKGRRSLCYDREALESRKDHPPKNSAIDLVQEIGAELLTEEQYHQLQQLGEFDLKTSSWLATPEEIRKLEELFLRTVAMVESSSITMEPSHIMQLVVFAAV